MTHGGPRPGAGRKVGAVTTKTREVAEQAVKSGITPLEFMLQVMRDESAKREERLDMAKAAAPYIHPRLSSIEARVDAEVKSTVRKIERHVIDPQHSDAAGLPPAAEAGEV